MVTLAPAFPRGFFLHRYFTPSERMAIDRVKVAPDTSIGYPDLVHLHASSAEGTIKRFVLCLVLVSSAAQGAVYQSTDEKGRAVFTQSPCGAGAAEVTMNPTPAAPVPEPTLWPATHGSAFVGETGQCL
jgi:hypothetical protein